MPAKYDAIKQKFIRMGESTKQAEKRAAMIYNGTRPEGAPPVTRNYDKTAKKQGGQR